MTTRPRPAQRSRGAGQPDLLGWLGADARMAGVVVTALRCGQIRRALMPLLPAGLADAVVVVKLDAGQLTLAAPNAAVVAKLRQLAPRLVEGLRQQGWHVDTVQIRIQATAQAQPPSPPRREAVALDAQALQAFATLYQRLPRGPLADAVARLLRHHGAA